MQIDRGAKEGEKVKIMRTRRGTLNPFRNKSSSISHDTTSSRKRSRSEEHIYPLASQSEASDEVNKEKKRNGPNGQQLKVAKTDDFNQRTPNAQNKTCCAPSSSSPESAVTLESVNRQRSEEVAWNIPFADEDKEGYEAASPENKLIEHLKKLSEMEPGLKRSDFCDMLISTSADSKFADAWRDVGRGMKQLKEGLGTITI